MTTPALEAAIKSGCEAQDGMGTCAYPFCKDCCGSYLAITTALRSLATPTPEVIEAMARDWRGLPDWDDLGEDRRQGWREETTELLAIYWGLILGETK